MSSSIPGIFLSPFDKPILEGTLIKRYKRFLADVEIPALGNKITVHCPNTGSMLGLNTPGGPVLISDSQNPNRKLRYTLECVQINKTWVCVNTVRANYLTSIIIEKKMIPALTGFNLIKREPRFDKHTRFDFLLQNNNMPDCCMFLEVKSVTLSREKGIAQFPDTITQRGQKHLEILTTLADSGKSACLVFLTMRSDCSRFSPASDIDQRYSQLLIKALKAGVLVFTPAVHITKRGFTLQTALKTVAD